MNSSNEIWVFAFVIGVIGIFLVLGYIAGERRKKELAGFADAVGLYYSPDAGDVHARYERFDPFGRGRAQRSSNLLHGRRGEIEWEMFDYRYTTGSGKNKKTHRYGIAAARVPLHFKRMQIRPEGFFDKLASMVGYDDINFESEEFSRRYHMSCDVRKFAYDLIHPQMIEFLLTCPPRHWQLAGPVILLHKRGRFSPRALAEVVAMVEGFLQRVPAYVREDMKIRTELDVL